jgi:multiple sugar transport system substrate-binding protein
MKKLWLSVIALGLAVVAVVSAQKSYLPPLPKNTKVSITFYNYNLASAGIGAEGTKQLIAEFEAANPNISVEGVPAPSNEILARLQADVVAGRTPDLAQIVFADYEFAINNLGVKPLEDLISDRELQTHYVGLHPRGLALARLNGKTYGLPYVFSTPVLFYNADVFKAAGLDPNRPPRSWAEVKKYALQIKAKANKAGVYVALHGAFDWMYQSLLLSNGGRVMSEDRKRLTFADAPALEAVRMLRDLVTTGAHPNVAASDAQAAMAAGNMGMYLQTSALQNYLLNASKDKFDLRSAKMPSFGTKTVYPVNSGSGVFIMAKDPLKQRAAWELMKFLTSKRGYTIITSKIGYVPLRPDIVKDPAYLKPWADANPLIKPNLEQLDRLSPWVPIPGQSYKQITKIMMDALDQSVFGNGDVDDTMKAASVRASSLMPNQ